MATKRIKDLTAITTPVGSDFVAVDGTTTRTITVDNLFRHRFPAGSTDNRAVRFDGTSAVLQSSSVEIDDSGRVLAGAGTASLPAHSFLGDTDTGAWNPSSDVWAVSVGGTEAVRVDGTGLRAGGNYMAPRPLSASGVGQFTALSSAVGGALSLPSGGTWAFFVIAVNNSTGGVSGSAANIASGGTAIGTATAGIVWLGFAWRVT